MSVVLDLPVEISEYARADLPQTLLVRGLPGTGKTMFSLALLRSFPGRRVYISSRVTTAELRREFPWLGNNGDRIETIDASDWSGGVRRAAEMLDGARSLVLHPETSREMRSLWLPEPILEMWSRLDPSSPSMVVVDSWDALIEQYLGFRPPNGHAVPDRSEVERILIDQLTRATVFLVLITERDELTQLDYLVNGVVQTGWERGVDRPERWMWLRKLRGVRINNPEYPYTLEGGRFACITPVPPDYRTRMVAAVPEPDDALGFIWPGTPDFASAFGRLPLRKIGLLEKQAMVPSPAVRMVLGPMVSHVVGRGGRVVHVLPPDIFPDDLWDGYRAILSHDRFLRQVRIQSVAGNVSEEVQPVVLRSPRASGGSTEPHFTDAHRFLHEASPEVPNLMVIWLDGLEAIASSQGYEYSPKGVPAIALQYVTTTPSHLLFVGNAESPFTAELRSIASLHIQFGARNGRVFVSGTKPLTPPFVLTDGEGNGPYHLIRVV